MTTPRSRKPSQHDTENISEDQFREYFHRLGWLVDRIHDYGEDLIVRICEEGAFTGKAFYVQLKGTKDIQQYALKSGDFSYEVDAVNVLQWHRNEISVIFVLWDIEQRAGNWLHIQSYVDTKLKNDPSWLHQEKGKRNIHIPFDQKLPFGEDTSLLTLINAGQPLWQRLDKVNQALEEVDTHYRLDAHLTSAGIQIAAVEKYPGASLEKPFNITVTTSIPTDTEEGLTLSKRVDQFITTGVPVRVPLSYVTNLEVPEFIKQVLPEITKDGFLVLGPAYYPKSLRVRIEFSNDDGEDFTLEYVHLKVTNAGTKEVTFTNDEQPGPIKVKITIHWDMNSLTAYFWFQSSLNQNVHQLLQQVEIVNCLSKPYTLHLVNLDTGLPYAVGKQSIETKNAVDQHFLEIIRALNALQVKTSKTVTIPDRSLITEEEQSIERLRLIFLTGKLEETVSGLTNTVSLTSESRVELQQWLDSTDKTISGPIPIEETITIFGEEYPLGPTELIYLEAKLINEQEVREKLSSQLDGELVLRFIPTGDTGETTIVKEYLDWLPATGETAS